MAEPITRATRHERIRGAIDPRAAAADHAFREADRLAWQFGLTYLSPEGLHKLAKLIEHVRSTLLPASRWG